MIFSRRSSSSSSFASASASPSTSRTSSLVRHSSISDSAHRASIDSSRLSGPHISLAVQGSLTILDFYETKPNGWYMHVQSSDAVKSARKGKGKSKESSSGEDGVFSIPIRKKKFRAAETQWDLTDMLDAQFPGWQDNPRTRSRIAKQYAVSGLAYYEYNRPRRAGAEPPRQVCEFALERRVRRDSLLKRLLGELRT